MNNREDELIKKIEELNNEYLTSGEYALGGFFKYIIKLLKQRKILNVFRLYQIHLKNKKKKKKCEENNIHKSDVYIVENPKPYKIAIYTCITGDYDQVEEPLIAESCCDYILFTNNPNLKSDFWNVKRIPENISDMDNARINRYIKMHPKELFPEYDYSIYIDGNVQLISKISQFVEKASPATGLAIHRHCERNCIYDEVKACRAYGKGKYANLKKQAARYKQENFPAQYGMLECNILVSHLKNETSVRVFNKWWDEYLKSESMRDQIALPYVLWKEKIKIQDIGNLGDNVNKNYLLKIKAHK